MRSRILKYFLSAGTIFIFTFVFKLNFLEACMSFNGYEKEKVLQIDVGNLKDGIKINNGIIYIENRNSRLVNAKELPQGGLVTVSPYNVYIKGDYNYDPAKSPADNDDLWRPSAIITNSLVYFLSENFDDPGVLPALRVNRDYGREINMIKTDEIYSISLRELLLGDDNAIKNALISEVETYFGLSNFTLPSISDSDDQAGVAVKLVMDIRSHYNQEYGPDKTGTFTYQITDDDKKSTNVTGTYKTPNIAKETIVRVAIASPYDITLPNDKSHAYQLEDWSQAGLFIKGAFIQLKDSWANDVISGTPIRDIPWWSQLKRAGGPNANNTDSWDTSSSASVSTYINARTPGLEYEENFADADERPSGDFFAGSQPWWQELSATPENFTHHTS